MRKVILKDDVASRASGGNTSLAFASLTGMIDDRHINERWPSKSLVPTTLRVDMMYDRTADIERP